MQVRHSSPGQPRRLHLRATVCHQPQRMPPPPQVILEVTIKGAVLITSFSRARTHPGSAHPKAYAAAATPQQRQQPMQQTMPTEHSQASVDASRSALQHGGAQQGGAQQHKPANPEQQMAHQQIAAHSPSMPQVCCTFARDACTGVP